MDDSILVKYIKIDGQTFENPLPIFEYVVKVGTWCVLVDTERHADFFAARLEKEVEVEVGMDFGTLRDVGRVRTWRGELPNAPSFLAKIEGSDPMQFVER